MNGTPSNGADVSGSSSVVAGLETAVEKADAKANGHAA